MSHINVRDIAYGRLRSPDLDQQQAFLIEFGRTRVARTTTPLYMRGTAPDQFIHVTGSQVFDYCADPWGRLNEHWSDTDRLNADNAGNEIEASVGMGSQWGEPAPQKFIERIVP